MWQRLGIFVVFMLCAAQTVTAQVREVPTVIEEDESEAAPAPETDGDASAAEEDDDSPEYADDLTDFIPSEEVAPDEQLIFPVDI